MAPGLVRTGQVSDIWSNQDGAICKQESCSTADVKETAKYAIFTIKTVIPWRPISTVIRDAVSFYIIL